MHVTRRSVLIGAIGLALAGCRPKPNRPPASPAGDRAALDAALAAERQLLAGYDTAAARLDAVAALPLIRARDRHAVHLAALTSASGTPSPSATSVAPAAEGSLRAALRDTSRVLQTAASTAVDGNIGALLASIAAEHAADAAVRDRA